MGTDELPVETDPSDAANLKSDSGLGADGPMSSHSIFLWQYEFEQSLINQQLQYQQQAVAMEVSIKAAALQAVTGAAEVSKLLKQENDASVVDVVKELTSSPRRLIGERKPHLPSPTLEFLRSNSMTTSLIGLEKEGDEKESGQSTRQWTEGMRSSRTNERRRNHRSRSCSREIRRRHKSRSRSRERRRRHRSRSRSRERRRRHGSRSRSREKRTRRRSRSKERRGRPRSRSKTRGKRHESKSRRRGRSKSLESCKSREGHEKRRPSHTARSPSKGSTPDGISFPGKSIRSEHFGVGESEGREEASMKMITGAKGQEEVVPHEEQRGRY